MAQLEVKRFSPPAGAVAVARFTEGPGPLVVERSGLAAAHGPLYEVLTVARGEMASLYRQTAAWGRGVLLTDGEGQLINAIGEPELLFTLTASPALPALGRAGGAPVFDAWGEALALLDAPVRETCPSGEARTHVRALVVRSALAIGNAHFRHHFRAHRLLSFHLHPEGLGEPGEGLLAVDEDERILAVNPGALVLLGRRRDQLLGQPLATLLQPLAETGRDRTFWDGRGRRHWARWEAPDPALLPPPRLSLAQLQGSDPLMAYNVRAARRVLARGIPLLLQGEPGSGRETFARALHRDGPRARQPFVAVNCDGSLDWEAVTIPGGIMREGIRERLTAARGGTLFLREAGELPPSLQSRLRQGLAQEGADVHLISSTRRDLAVLTTLGAFREDLYYHLNGLTLTLPALRERPDRQTLIRNVLAARHGDLHLEEEALADLAARPWPGNLQQLGEVLERAVARCRGGVLRRSDLPVEDGADRPVAQATSI